MLVTYSKAQPQVVQSNYHIETAFTQTKSMFRKLHECTSSWRYSGSRFQDGKRSIKNCIGFGNCLIYDVDNDGVVDFTVENAVEHFSNIQSLIVTTKSHKKEKNGKVADRFRVIIPVDSNISVDVDDYSVYYTYVAEFLGIEDYIDHSCKDAARMYQPNPNQEEHYSKSQTVLSEKQLRISFEEKRFLETSTRESYLVECPPDLDGSKTDYLRSILHSHELLKLMQHKERFICGNRNNYLFSVAHYLLDNNLNAAEVREALYRMNSIRNPLSTSELERTVFRSLAI